MNTVKIKIKKTGKTLNTQISLVYRYLVLVKTSADNEMFLCAGVSAVKHPRDHGYESNYQTMKMRFINKLRVVSQSVSS